MFIATLNFLVMELTESNADPDWGRRHIIAPKDVPGLEMK